MSLPAKKIKQIQLPNSDVYEIIPERLQKSGFEATLPTLVRDSVLALKDDVASHYLSWITVTQSNTEQLITTAQWEELQAHEVISCDIQDVKVILYRVQEMEEDNNDALIYASSFEDSWIAFTIEYSDTVISTINGVDYTGILDMTYGVYANNLKTLDTTATASQVTSSSEQIDGATSSSNKIVLHKISKTGSYSDLNGLPNIPSVSLTTTEGSEKITVNNTDLTVVTRTTNQTITGTKTFSNGIIVAGTNNAQFSLTAKRQNQPDYVDQFFLKHGNTNIVHTGDSSYTIWLDQTTFGKNINPQEDDTYNLGSEYYHWKDLYLSGKIYGSSYNYTLPSATGTLALTSDIKNATLTITQNSTSVGTFTANASSNVTIEITTPQVKRFI